MIKTPLSTMIGGAFWTPESTILGGTSNTFNQLIKPLFANNEQGFAYDPNDLTTMFQDVTGTIPVTAAGQPVGLMLDKSKGIVLGSDIVTNGDFSAGSIGWTTTGTVTIVNGTANFNNEANGSNVIQLTPAIVIRRLYKITYTITSITSGSVSLGMGGNFGVRRFTAGTYTEYLFAQSSNVYVRAREDGTTAIINNIVTQELLGNHAYQTTSASRPILRQNATTGAYYLEFDGSDDSLQTSNIDFTATDKVSLFTGVQKLRSSTAESILELGVLPYDGVGTFWLTTNALAPDDVWMAIAQSWNARTGFSKITPVANNFIFSAKLDFAGSVAKDEVKPRLNGSTTGFTRGLLEHAGTGNFGNHPLYIGRRAGTSLPFNGHIYSLIGVGRLTTDDETIALEQELAKRTGVTLNV